MRDKSLFSPKIVIAQQMYILLIQKLKLLFLKPTFKKHFFSTVVAQLLFYITIIVPNTPLI